MTSSLPDTPAAGIIRSSSVDGLIKATKRVSSTPEIDHSSPLSSPEPSSASFSFPLRSTITFQSSGVSMLDTAGSITGAPFTAVIVTVISWLSINPPESINIKVTTLLPDASATGVTVSSSVTGLIEAAKRVSSTPKIDHSSPLPSPEPSSVSVSLPLRSIVVTEVPSSISMSTTSGVITGASFTAFIVTVTS